MKSISYFLWEPDPEGGHTGLENAASPPFEDLCSLQPGEKRLHLEERRGGMVPLFTASPLTRVEVAAISTVLTADLKPTKCRELFPPLLGVLAGTANWAHYSGTPGDFVLPSHRALTAMAHDHSDF